MEPTLIGNRNFVNPIFPILISSVRTQKIESRDLTEPRLHRDPRDLRYHQIAEVNQGRHSNSARENAAIRFKSRIHPVDLPSQVKLVKWENGAQVYLIGTAHLSNASNIQVEELISKVKPDRVMVELCEERRGLMYFQENQIQSISWGEIKNVIKTKGIGPAMLLIPLLLASSEVIPVIILI